MATVPCDGTQGQAGIGTLVPALVGIVTEQVDRMLVACVCRALYAAAHRLDMPSGVSMHPVHQEWCHPTRRGDRFKAATVSFVVSDGRAWRGWPRSTPRGS
jgi:hypothetical protein